MIRNLLHAGLLLGFIITFAGCENKEWDEKWDRSIIDASGGAYEYCSLMENGGVITVSYLDTASDLIRYGTFDAADDNWDIFTVVNSITAKFIDFDEDSTGYLHFAYLDTATNTLTYSTNLNDVVSSFPVALVGAQGGYPSIAITDSGGALSYYNALTGNLDYAAYDLSTWTAETVDSSVGVGKYSSLVLDSGGAVHICYYDETNGDLKYATNSSSAWVVQTLDSDGDIGKGAALCIDEDDTLYVSYTGTVNTEEVLNCAKGSTGLWQTETVFRGVTAPDTSITVDSSGAVHIVYQGNNHCRYATDALGGWKNFDVDTWAGTGEFSSIAVDDSLNIFIMYSDSLSTVLKYAGNHSITLE